MKVSGASQYGRLLCHVACRRATASFRVRLEEVMINDSETHRWSRAQVALVEKVATE